VETTDPAATYQGHLSRRLHRLPWPNLPMTLILGQYADERHERKDSSRAAGTQPVRSRWPV